MDYATQLVRPFSGSASERAARIEERLAPSIFLGEALRRRGYDSSERWAWDEYRPLALELARMQRGARRRSGERVRMLEIGGGRGPMFTPAQAEAAGIALTVNDIDAHELAMAPAEHEKAHFDIADDIDPALRGSFDLIVSRMVMEHVRDARRAWANMAALLAPGGVVMAFHPTLYAPPFLINLMLPEALTARVLRIFFPNRHDEDYPKFPARYDLCYADPRRVGPVLKACGFSEILIAPIWGHGYFRSLPGLRELDATTQRLAEAREWRSLCTYAFTLARV
jgi:SAM-dependent methyltransferase